MIWGNDYHGMRVLGTGGLQAGSVHTRPWSLRRENRRLVEGMLRRFRTLPPLALCLLALAAPALAQDGHAPQSPEAQVFSRVCGKCHPAQAVTGVRKTQSQWEETFFKMIDEQGAKASDEDFHTAFEYVVRNFGRVNVNQATTNELTTILGWSKKEANAVIDYRDAHGNFADLDAVAAVPGLDAAKVQAAQDAITF
jgi:competence ComEA-like helix-hairpin-helix protein